MDRISEGWTTGLVIVLVLATVVVMAHVAGRVSQDVRKLTYSECLPVVQRGIEPRQGEYSEEWKRDQKVLYGDRDPDRLGP